MKKLLLLPAVCLLLAGGCASTAQVRKLEENSRANQTALHETDRRLQKLEQSVAALDNQVAALNNRVYEVRTRGGRKTGLTIVPIIQPRSVSAVNSAPLSRGADGSGMPASQNVPSRAVQPEPGAQNGRDPQSVAVSTKNAAASPTSARVINPAAPPTPLPGKSDLARATGGDRGTVSGKSGTVGPSGQVGKPDRVAGPAGQLTANEPAAVTPALPPVEIPAVSSSQTGALPASNAHAGNSLSPSAAASPLAASGAAFGNASVPVPTLPASDLALPPEHPSLPPLDASGAGTSASPVSRESAVAQPASSPKTLAAPQTQKGEESAYKAALQVALSGRSAEGIARFREFLQQYPQGRYAANAEYWIGECLYAQGKLQEALAQFEKVNAAYPRHHKNADALLKAAMCLSRLGDKQGATQKYKRLLADFPNSEAARLARARGLAR